MVVGGRSRGGCATLGLTARIGGCKRRGPLGSIAVSHGEDGAIGSQRSRRVLIVEDDAQVSAFLQELLVRDGYEVQQARHGAEAMVLLTGPVENLPDLVVLDINLPLQSGVEVLVFLRDTLHSRIPVVVLTASATQDQEEDLNSLGVSAYLRKPVTSAVLLSEVERALA